MSAPKKQLPLAGSERVPLEGAREIGPANPNKTVDVTIRVRSRAGKKSIVSDSEFAKPIEKRTILSREEFKQRHGADPESIARVESFARQHKLSVKETSPARRTVIISVNFPRCGIGMETWTVRWRFRAEIRCIDSEGTSPTAACRP
jgi:kumamolisin